MSSVELTRNMGVGVILGEYGVISRMGVPDHEAHRVYWNGYVTRSAVDHDVVPIYWDNCATGEGGMGLFDRATGNQVYPDIISAMVRGVAHR